ncbi:hypothetical protein [Stagnimonas aquatica]|nr:hypothetical protein [Stagnimonas aquatica]
MIVRATQDRPTVQTADLPALEPSPRWRMLLGGLPDLATAATCLLCWWQPRLLGTDWIKPMLLTVLVEFLVIHSGVFMAVFGNAPKTRLFRSLAHLGLAGFYGLFVWLIARDYEAPWLYALFGWLFFSKLLVCWSAQPLHHPSLREQLIDWPMAVASYLLSLVLGGLLFEAQRGGLDYRLIREAGLSGKPMFEQAPWTLLASGALYFTAMGLYRMRLWRWRRPGPQPAASN